MATIIGRQRACLFLGAAATALIAFSAHAEQRSRITIPAQSLAPALRELSRQTGVNILFEPKTAQGRTAPKIGDSLTAEEAARRMVSASGLDVARDPSGGLLIREAPRPAPKPVNPIVRIATVGAPAPPVSTVEAPPLDEGSLEPASQVDQVLVTASRVRSGFVAPTPTTVVGQAQVQARGATNVADVLNEVPAFRATHTAASTTRSSAFPGGTFLDLRGLNGNDAQGTARTLVLVDGRRHVPTTANMQVDLNMIPTSLVDRTEVVTGGASAAWGSDAVAGVVNLILKSQLNGLEGSLSYGQTDKSDYKEFAANAAWGGGFAGGKGHIIIGADYVKNEGVPDAFVSRDWGRANPGALIFPATRAAGLPQKIISYDVVSSDRMTNGGIIIGGPLDNTAFLPGGATTTFVNGPLTSGDLMIQGANTINAEVTQAGGSQLVNPLERYSALARVNYDFSSLVSGFLELSQGESHLDALSGQRRDNGTLTIQRDNAFLPEAVRQRMVAANITTFVMGRIANDAGYGTPGRGGGFYRRRTDLKLQRAVAGLNGSVFGNWKWDTYVELGRSEYTQFGQATIQPNLFAAVDAIRDAGGNIVCRPGATLNAAAPGCVPFNVFGQNAPSQAAIGYVLGAGVNHVTLHETAAAFNVAGDLFTLPAGPVSVAAGLEYRKDSVKSDVSADSQAGRLDTASYQPIQGSYNTKEAYAEVVVPLLRDATFAKALEANAAIRTTDYSTSGRVTTWKVGATWDPIESLRFRATKSRDIRAPNLSELFQRGNLIFSNVVNPRTGLAGQVATIVSGNPQLRPEIADTITGGVVFQPTFLSGFRASLDYYQIRIDGVVAQYVPQRIVDGCQAGDQTLCTDLTYNGATLDQIRLRSFNFAKLETRGYDVEVAYRADNPLGAPGTLNLRALGTNVIDLTTTNVTGKIDRAGQLSPKWSWNFSANYDLGRFSANAQVRLLTGVVIDTTYFDPSDAGYVSTSPFSTNRNHQPDVAYLNLSASYRLIERQDGRSLQLYAVANNVFDTDPPLGSTANGGNSSIYDLIGRSFRAGVRFKY